MTDWQEGWKAPRDGSWIIALTHNGEKLHPQICRWVEREYTAWRPVKIEGDPRELQEVLREQKHGFFENGFKTLDIKWWKPLGPLPE